jgi:hypothetical protein
MEKTEEKKEVWWHWIVIPLIFFMILVGLDYISVLRSNAQLDYEAHLTLAERTQLQEQRTADAKAYNEGWAIFYGNVTSLIMNPLVAWMVVWMLIVMRLINRRWI